jgi:hypothetical protein
VLTGSPFASALGLVGLAHPRRDIALAMQHTPDVYMPLLLAAVNAAPLWHDASSLEGRDGAEEDA